MTNYKAVYSAINGGWTVRQDNELGETKLIAKTGPNEGEIWAERIANALNQMEIES